MEHVLRVGQPVLVRTKVSSAALNELGELQQAEHRLQVRLGGMSPT